MERLDAIPPAGLGFVVAPAGSGKSVLLSQWAESRPDLVVCGITVDRRHDDPVVFHNSLIAAIAAGVPAIATELGEFGLAGGSEVGEIFVERFSDSLAHSGANVAVLIDDAHHLTNGSLLGALDSIIRRLPANVRVVIAARWDPPLHLRALRSNGRLVELRMADLAFDEAEAGQLITDVAGIGLDADQVTVLTERTDGWAAGLQLAAISLQHEPDVDSFVASFDGNDRLVVEYLTEVVLDHQTDAVRHFLLQTSVLPWLSAELCDAVTGSPDSHELLQQVAAQSLFLVPLDRRGARFRYHHLFADLLRQQLRDELGVDRDAELRRTAAEWFHAHGHVGDAVDQFLGAGEPLTALELVMEHGREFHMRGQMATLARWLHAIEGAVPVAPVSLEVNLLAAYVAADDFVEAAETYRRLSKRADLVPGEQAAVDSLYACLGIQGLSIGEAAAVATSVLERLPGIDPTEVTDFLGIGGVDSVEALAEFMCTTTALLEGDLRVAQERLRTLVSLPALQYPMWKIQAWGTHALVCAWAGRLDEALRSAAVAVDTAVEAGVPRHTYQTVAHQAVALVGLERHDLVLASQALRDAALLCERSGRAVLLQLQRLLTTRLTAVTEGPMSALDCLRTTPTPPLTSPALDAATRALKAQLYLDLDEVPAARTALEVGVGSPYPSATRIELLIRRGDLAAARRDLEVWQPDSCDLTGRVERSVSDAAVLEAEGDRAGAQRVLLDAVSAAEPEDLRRPFLASRSAMRLLRSVPTSGQTPFRRSLIDVAASASARSTAQTHLIEPLTGRELAVLDLLPSRLSNRDIARQLYVSVNTVKTHLRSIYRKLEVADRDAAITRATELGLL